MQPNSEPSQSDVQAVSSFLGQDTQPQMQPDTPVSQPAPTQQPAQQPTQQPTQQQPAAQETTEDPFATLFATEPTATEVSQSTQEPQEVQATEVSQQPVETQQSAQQQQPTIPDPQQIKAEYETYDEYMARVTQGIPDSPALPDAESVDPNDPTAIKGFFDDLVNSAVAQAEARIERKNAIQNSEKTLWDAAMDKYGTLRTNKEVRDMVHNIRLANFQRGIAMTPTQAADKLLSTMQSQYQKGVADNQVVTTYEQVQPTGGQTGQPMETTLNQKSSLESIQTGGENALAELLDAEIKAGRL